MNQASSAPRIPNARLRRFFFTVLPLVGALHAYIGWQILPALPLDHLGRFAGAMLLALSAVLIPVGLLARFLVLPHKTADRLIWAGSLFLGLFSSLLVFTLLRGLSLLIYDSLSFEYLSACVVIIAALFASGLGYVNARRIARVVQVDVRLANLPAALENLRIVQLSDLHVGATIKRDYIAAIVARVNALQPDVIAITGDLVDGTVADLAAEVAPLADLRARHGVFCVTGNHEYYSGAAAWGAEFERLGMCVLQNAHVIIEHDAQKLVIAGVTDYSAGHFDAALQSDPHAALLGAPANLPKILLAHQPRSAEAAAQAGFDLQLSGHTHGGQFWPWNHFVPLQQPYIAGLHRLRNLWVYTSRGTGYWGPPKRFGAPSEITLLSLYAE